MKLFPLLLASALAIPFAAPAQADCGGGNGSEDPPSRGCQPAEGGGGTYNDYSGNNRNNDYSIRDNTIDYSTSNSHNDNSYTNRNNDYSYRNTVTKNSNNRTVNNGVGENVTVRGGRGGAGGTGYGFGYGEGGKAEQAQQQSQAQLSTSESRAKGGNSKNSNTNNSAVKDSGNSDVTVKGSRDRTVYERPVAIAPLPITDSVGRIGDVVVPLPHISGSAYTSTQPNGELDYGASVGFRIPLGTGEFRAAASEERQRRNDRGEFRLIQEAVWLKEKGLLSQEAHPRHYAALYGTK